MQARSATGVQYPADITNTAGITDVAGNRLSITTGAGVDLAIGE